ncbi:MAG: EAL domain-containing protein [Pacificimonas sp.]
MRLSATLSGKLAASYAAMFAAVILILLGVLNYGISGYAETVARQEMDAGAASFLKDVLANNRRMKRDAEILAKDFGFRRAAATGDVPTITSALHNLAGRGGRELMLYAGQDGVFAGTPPMTRREEAKLTSALESGAEWGALTLGGEDYGVVIAPVRAPMTIGWVAFGERLDPAASTAAKAGGQEHLTAHILRFADLPAELAARVPDSPMGDGSVMARDVDDNSVLTRLIPLMDLDGTIGNQVLVIDFSMDGATASYRRLFLMIAVISLAGLLVVTAASWLIARAMTRPLATLERAVRRVTDGGREAVEVGSRDEIGRLAVSFNAMVEAVSAHEDEITHMAFHDALTGLPNRKYFIERLDSALAMERPLAVLAIDLDDFKAINDSLGHPVGDRFLCAVASSFRESLPGHVVARFGGDEFAVLIEDEDPAQAAAVAAETLKSALASAFDVDGHALTAGASMGVAVAPTDGGESDRLFKNADLALYRVKANGRGDYCFFEPAMDAAAQERRDLDMGMRSALENDEFCLHFQPLFHLGRNRICSFEALIRWQHPTRGLVSPLMFIPLAEQNGLIVPIGEWVITEALKRLREWPEEIGVAVNISPAQFRSPGLIRFIDRALEASGIDPKRLELEVTESVFIEDVEETLAGLHGLRALGVRVALDDFGTGFSSLSYLRKFPFDKIKIDRSFINELATSDNAPKIVHAITHLAETMGMETTAEGVEDENQVALIRDQGCTHIQGFYFSRPLPGDQIPDILRAINGADADAAARAAGEA